MNLPKIPLNSNRRISCSTNSKSTYSLSTSSSNKSKQLNPTPILIQLCMYPDENYAYRTMRLLLSSRHQYSPNVCDEFGCNVLMYSLRYQRYRLFELLLNDISFDLNLHAKDRHGNTILHYVIIYGGNNTRIIEILIEKYKEFASQIDERNNFGFTPLLLAVFCGRYDYVLTLLSKSNASPFVRDYIQLKNMFDYIEIDIEYQKKSQISYLNSDTKRLNYHLYQTIPCRRQTYVYKNFFELFLEESIQDQTGLYRSLILEVFHLEYLTNLLNYLNQRYPKIQTSRRIKENSTIKIIQRENSKINVHNILNLFDPELKTKAIPPPPPPPPTEEDAKPIARPSITFKRLSTKITTLAAFSKTQVGKKQPSLTTTRVK